MPKSKLRGRKRKASPTLDSECSSTSTDFAESLPGQEVKHSSIPTTVITSTNRVRYGTRYVPRFGSAAKRQRIDSDTKKINRDASGEGEEGDVLLPISCTQPVGGAMGAKLDTDAEGEWSSTQPAPKPSLVTQVEAGTNSLPESQQDIPGARETKLSGERFVPDLPLSHGLTCFPNQMQHDHDDTNAEGINNPHSVETQRSNIVDDTENNEPEGTNTAESDSKPSNERAVDNKCLDLLNPLSEDLEEDNVSDSVEEGKHSQPLATASTPPTDSHESAAVNWSQDNRVNDAVLCSTDLEQTIAEPIVESFYAIMSQEKPVDGSCSDVCRDETKSDLVLASTSDEDVAMREMEELRAVDLQESQLFAMAVEDQAAHVHTSSLTTNTCFMDAKRRPSVCSQDAALQEGTRTVQGLVDELSALNRFILHCKKELETAFRRRRGTRPHQHQPRLHSGRNHLTHTHW